MTDPAARPAREVTVLIGADEMQLSVWSGNHGAQRFYARYGFEKVADVHFWVGAHRDDEFLLSLMLVPSFEGDSGTNSP